MRVGCVAAAVVAVWLSIGDMDSLALIFGY